jgi:serpin B
MTPFSGTKTADHTFIMLDDSTMNVSMMNGSGDTSGRGNGWVGATKQYVGGLTAQFILPDHGRFDEVAADLDRVVSDYDAGAGDGSPLGVPRFDLRFGVELSDVLRALGLTAPFQGGGLLGVADDPRLQIDRVIHQTVVSMDEEGTEAAAATAVVIYAGMARVVPPAPVILDRPFLYRILDSHTQATLFIGQVVNPLM